MSSRVLLSGISCDTSRNILFQAAVYWAEEGSKVLYLTKSKFQSIPSTVHGPQIPSSEVLAKIRIVYLESMEELLRFVVDLLTFRDAVPGVVLVEGLQEYAETSDSRDVDHRLARVCATLCHATACCEAHSAATSRLLVTLNTPLNKLPPVVCSMFHTVWSYDDDTNSLTRILPIDSSPTCQLTLAHRTDGALVLKDVKSVFS